MTTPERRAEVIARLRVYTCSSREYETSRTCLERFGANPATFPVREWCEECISQAAADLLADPGGAETCATCRNVAADLVELFDIVQEHHAAGRSHKAADKALLNLSAMIHAYREAPPLSGAEPVEPQTPAQTQGWQYDRDEAIERLRWIKEFCEAHHAGEPAGVHLHRLLVDIPSYLDYVLGVLEPDPPSLSETQK